MKAETQGGRLLGLLLLALFAYLNYGRLPFAQQEAPAIVVESPKILISLGKGFVGQGVHQFSDASAAESVIKLTEAAESQILVQSSLELVPLQSGESLALEENRTKKQILKRFWMPAAQRMALHLPLYPDRMEETDWLALPGIGPSLAHRIEINRQKYGEFRSLKELKRVSGVGPAFVEKNSQFFSTSKSLKNK